MEEYRNKDLDSLIQSKLHNESVSATSTNELRGSGMEIEPEKDDEKAKEMQLQLERMERMEEKCRQMESENIELSNQIIRLTPEVKSLTKQNEQLQKELHDVITERDQLLIEKEGILSERDSIALRVEEQSTHVFQLQSHIEEQKKIEKNYINEVNYWKKQNEETERASKAELESRVKEKEEEIGSLQQDLLRVGNESQMMISEMERVQNQYQELVKEYSELESSILQNEQDKLMIQSLQETIVELNKEIQASKEAVNVLQLQLVEKEQASRTMVEKEQETHCIQLDLLTKEKEANQIVIQEQQQQLEDLQNQLYKKDEILQAYEMKASLSDQKEKQIAKQLTSEIEELKKQKHLLEITCSNHESQIKQAHMDLSLKEQELQSSKDYINQIRLQIRTLEMVIQSNDNEIDELKACVVVGDDDIDRLTRLLVEQKKKSSQERTNLYSQFQSDFDIYKQELVHNFTQEEVLMMNYKIENEKMAKQLAQLQENWNSEREVYEMKIRELDEIIRQQQIQAATASKEPNISTISTISNISAISNDNDDIQDIQDVQDVQDIQDVQDGRISNVSNISTLLKIRHFTTESTDTEKQELEAIIRSKESEIQQLKEDRNAMEMQLKEEAAKFARLKQTVLSKYAEFNEMKESNETLVNDLDLLRRKYTYAKGRIAKLEKSKISVEDMEKIKQLLLTKEAKDKEIVELRQQIQRLSDLVKETNEEKTRTLSH